MSGIGPYIQGDVYADALKEEKDKMIATKPPIPTIEGAAALVNQQQPQQAPQNVTTTVTTEKGFKPSDSLMSDLTSSIDKQAGALRQAADAERTSLQAEVTKNEELSKEKYKELEKAKTISQEYKTKLADEIKRYDTAYEDLKKASNIEVNPRAYIDNMSSGAKIGMALSLLLAGVGGADNVSKVMTIFNTAIDNDIKAQKMNKEGKVDSAKAGVEATKGKMQSLKESYLTDMQDYNMQKELRLEALENYLNSTIQKTKDPAIQARLEAGLAQVQQQKAETRFKIEEKAADKVKTEVRTEPKVKDLKSIEGLRKEFMSDPVVTDSLGSLSKISSAKTALRLAKEGDPAAIGTASTVVATAIQKGTLSEKDIARGSGIPTSIIKKGQDAIDQYIRDQPPRNQMKTLSNLLDAAEKSNKKVYEDRATYYQDLGRNYYGVTDKNLVTPPAPTTAAVGGTVKMVAPDGSVRDVPEDRVKEFELKGAKIYGR